jgi:hypothetical protein
VPRRAPRERVMEGHLGERIAIPPFWREAGAVRARRANLTRPIGLVNGLVSALDLRRCGRRPALIAVLPHKASPSKVSAIAGLVRR